MTSPRRLIRFADEHGLQFDRAPAVRRGPPAFRRYDVQKPVGWFGVPGPTGFEVGQRIESVALHTADNTAHTARLTWAVFTLRIVPAESGLAVAVVAPIVPAGWVTDRDGSELVIWTRRRTRLTSASLWSWLFRAQHALNPMLARPACVSEITERQRRGIRLAIAR